MVHATAAAIHDIDVGKVSAGRAVTVTGLVVTGLAFNNGFDANPPMQCRYRAFAQDPVGKAPCGIQLAALGPSCTMNASSGCDCPTAADSKTILSDLAIGDVVDLLGHVHLVAVDVDGGAVAEHELEVTMVTKTGTGEAMPTPISDPTLFAKDGVGYRDYESMLVALQPAAGITVTAPSAKFASFSGGGAFFAGTYADAFENGGQFPPAKSKWTSITGVANPRAGGGIAPRSERDFVQ